MATTKGAGVGPLRCRTSKGAEREEETEIKSLRDIKIGEVGKRKTGECGKNTTIFILFVIWTPNKTSTAVEHRAERVC
jgi:hypothetical protein